MLSRFGWAVLLATLVGASGCDLGCSTSDDGCSSQSSAFATRATLTSPASVAAGEPFEVVVTATPRQSGVGTVQIVTQVGLLRALAPVTDTLDLGDGTGTGLRAATRPVRVTITAGQPVRVAWTLAVDRTAPILNPGLGAIVAFDSVRVADGTLVEAQDWSSRYGPSPAGAITSTTAEVRPIRVAGQ